MSSTKKCECKRLKETHIFFQSGCHPKIGIRRNVCYLILIKKKCLRKGAFLFLIYYLDILLARTYISDIDNYKESDMQKQTKERIQKYGEIFTPENIVERMCNILQENNEENVYSIYTTFLEPSCGTGNFLVEILKRKMESISKIKSEKDYFYSSFIALSSIYGIEILHDNVVDCRKRIFETWKNLCIYQPTSEACKIAKNIIKTNIIWGDFLKRIDLKTNSDILITDYNWKNYQVSRTIYSLEDVGKDSLFKMQPKKLPSIFYTELA